MAQKKAGVAASKTGRSSRDFREGITKPIRGGGGVASTCYGRPTNPVADPVRSRGRK